MARSAELAIMTSYPTSASGIIVLLKTPKRIPIFELPSCFCQRVSAMIFVVNGIRAHIPLHVNQSKLRNCNIQLLFFNNYTCIWEVHLPMGAFCSTKNFAKSGIGE